MSKHFSTLVVGAPNYNTALVIQCLLHEGHSVYAALVCVAGKTAKKGKSVSDMQFLYSKLQAEFKFRLQIVEIDFEPTDEFLQKLQVKLKKACEVNRINFVLHLFMQNLPGNNSCAAAYVNCFSVIVRVMEELDISKFLIVSSSLLLGVPETEGLGDTSDLNWLDLQYKDGSPISRTSLSAMQTCNTKLYQSDFEFVIVCPGPILLKPRHLRSSRNGSWRTSLDSTLPGDFEAWQRPVFACDLALIVVDQLRILTKSGKMLNYRKRVGCYSVEQGNRGAHRLKSEIVQDKVYGVCFPRQSCCIGYNRALLNLPTSRWGQVSYHKPKPSHASGIRESRRYVARLGKQSIVRMEFDQEKIGKANMSFEELRTVSRNCAALFN